MIPKDGTHTVARENSWHWVLPKLRGFPAKWRLRNERRKIILMTHHYRDLGSASNWSGSYTSSVWNFYARFSDVISRTNQWWRREMSARLPVFPHFSSGIVERVKRERAWKSPHARKATRGVSPLSRVGWFSRALAFRSLYYPWGQVGDYS